MKKKVLPMLIALSMVTGTMPMTVFGSEVKPETDSVLESEDSALEASTETNERVDVPVNEVVPPVDSETSESTEVENEILWTELVPAVSTETEEATEVEETEEQVLQPLDVVSDIQGADANRTYQNVFFANGSNVTVAPAQDGQGLLVTVDDTTYTFANNSNSAESGLTIFAGGNDDNKSVNGGKIVIADGAKVYTVFGGGYNDSVVDGAEIVIEQGAEIAGVYGGGMTAAKDGTSKAQVENVTIQIDGTVTNVVYAGGNAAVGPQITKVVNYKDKKANNYVKNAQITIGATGDVDGYFGGSYSYGAVGTSNCDVYGTISGSYSAVAGANGLCDKATISVKDGGSITGDLYMGMRGYIGNVILENRGHVGRVSLNPDGKSVSSYGTVTVNNKDGGIIDTCNIDCGCEKATVDSSLPAYPEEISVSGDVEVTAAFWESNKDEQYEPQTGQTIYLKNGARLAEGESLDNVQEVGTTLTSLFAAANDGDTITLDRNYTVLGTTDADYKNSGTVTLDLAGNTIYGNNKNIAMRANAGNGKLIVTGGTIEAKSGTYCTVSAGNSTMELQDMTLNNCTPWGNSVKAFSNGHIILRNVNSTSTYGGGVEAAGGTVDVYDSHFEQTVMNDWNSVNLAASGNTGTVNVYGGTFTSENYGLYIFSSGGTFNVYDGTFQAGKAVLKGDLDLGSYKDAKGTFNIYDGDFTGKFEVNEKIDVNIYGGTFSNTGLDKEAFEKYVSASSVLTDDGNGVYTVTPLNKENAVAEIDGKYYASLNDAVAEVEKGDTIVILRDVLNASGISVPSGSDFTIDFGGHTYTLTGPGAGSAGTETSAFQLLKDSTIAMKNGTIRMAEGQTTIKRLIQNYADVTLEDMRFEAKNMVPNEEGPLTFNNGNIVFKGNTSVITSSKDTLAFDVYYWADSYPDGVSVTFDESFTGTINGKILYDSADPTKASLTIQGNGNFGSVEKSAGSCANPTIAISGGTFDQKPDDAYLAEGYTVIPNGGRYEVVEETNEDIDAEVKVSVDTEAAVPADIELPAGVTTKELKEELQKTSVSGMGAESVQEVTEQDVETAKEKLRPAEGQSVVIEMHTTLDIQVKDFDQKAGLTLDITPIYEKVAYIDGNESTKITLATGELEVTKAVTITVPVPAGMFQPDNLYVKHEHDGKVNGYAATLNNNVVTFTNPHGFSRFTIFNDTRSGSITYKDKDGAVLETVSYTAKDLDSTLKSDYSVSGYSFRGWNIDGTTYTVLTTELLGKIDGTSLDATPVLKKNSSGGGSHYNDTYAIKIEDTENGSVKANEDRASEGETVYLTVKADKGYVLDKLTVTDADDEKITVKEKGENEYTFTMPDAKVTVKATFVKETEEKPETAELPFTDVTEGNWFYKAVAYVYEQKLMSGVSETEFAPQTSLTRAMLAQVLYNMENQPEVTTTGAFTDVPDHQWYANAVNWAASENIVAGMGDGIFAPNSPVTREQMAAILYRYAQYKGYDTTKTADISDFADSNKTSAWAVPAMQWAVGTGLISGQGDGILAPSGTATRAEVAQILMNFCENIEK